MISFEHVNNSNLGERATRSKFERIIRTGFLGLTLLGGGEKMLQAKEIGPQMTWEEGVDVLQSNARHQTHESGAFYIRTTSGGGEWYGFGESEERNNRVRVEISDEEISKIISEGIESECFIHTHPNAVIRSLLERDFLPRQTDKTLSISEDVLVNAPPSEHDINNVLLSRNSFLQNELPEAIRFAVAGPDRVWVYHSATEADYQGHPELLIKNQRNIVLEKGIDTISDLLTRADTSNDVSFFDRIGVVLAEKGNSWVLTPFIEATDMAEKSNILKTYLSLKTDNSQQVLGALLSMEGNQLGDEILNLPSLPPFEEIDPVIANEEFYRASLRGELMDQVVDQLKISYLAKGITLQYVTYDEFKQMPGCVLQSQE